MIVPGGGLSEDGTRRIACRPNFFLAVRVLSRLFRRLVLRPADSSFAAGTQRSPISMRSPPSSSCSGDRNGWSIRRSLSADPKPFSRTSRATRIAISNRRLTAADAMGITFKYKDYRVQSSERYKLMTLFQGTERDIIFLSMVADPEHRTALTMFALRAALQCSGIAGS
jgi:hypothetical protein